MKIKPNNLNRLKKTSAIDTFQIRSVSTKRFLRNIGSISDDILENIKEAIKAVIDAD